MRPLPSESHAKFPTHAQRCLVRGRTEPSWTENSRGLIRRVPDSPQNALVTIVLPFGDQATPVTQNVVLGRLHLENFALFVADLKRPTDGSARGQVKGSTIGRELSLLRRCYKLGMKGNRPKVRAMPLIPRFKDNKRTGTLEFNRHDDLAEAYRTLGDHWHVPLEAVFETAYTFGWRHGEITPLKVRQFRDVSPTEAWLHLDADTTKNTEARDVPLGSWCVRLIAMLHELVKGKQPDDLIFTRGLNHRPVQRFDKLWRRGCRMAGVNESLLVHDLPTVAQRMLDAGIAAPRIMQTCGWKTMSTFLRYATTGRNVLRPELEKLVEFEREAETRAARTGKTE